MTEERKPYYGDLNKTNILRELFEVPGELRDENWKKTFLINVADASFQCLPPQVIEGPDGFPYFQLSIPEPFKGFQCFVIKHMKDDFLLEKGFGVVINPLKGEPDWVFSYGDIVSFHIEQLFYIQSKNWNTRKSSTISEQEEVRVGEPSESILPAQTRKVLREFLMSVGIADCKVFLMSQQRSGEYVYELVFNITPDKFQNSNHYQAVLQSIGWFLPRHYTFISMDESRFKDSFKPL